MERSRGGDGDRDGDRPPPSRGGAAPPAPPPLPAHFANGNGSGGHHNGNGNGNAHAAAPAAAALESVEGLRLAKLRAHCDELAGAVDAWERALRVLRVSHGEASALVRDATTAMNGAKAELAYGGAG